MRWRSVLPGLLLLAAAAGPAGGAAAEEGKPPPRLLSLMRANGKQGCDWLVLAAPDAAPARLATFPAACAGARVAIAKRGDQALVRFPASAAEGSVKGTGYPPPAFPAAPPGAGPEGLWQVTLGEAPKLLPAILDERLERAGFDENGQVLALTIVPVPKTVKLVPDTDDDGNPVQRFHFRDRPYAATVGDGQLAIAYAYRLAPSGAWQLVEDKPTSIGWSYALGVEALDAAKLWHAGADAAQDDWESQEVSSKVQGALRRILQVSVPAVGKDSNDGFTRLRSAVHGRGDLLVWQVAAEFAASTGLILFHAPGAKDFTPLPLGYTAGDLVRLSFQNEFGLVTTDALGAHPRLVDLRTGQIKYASDRDYAVAFWRQISM